MKKVEFKKLFVWAEKKYFFVIIAILLLSFVIGFLINEYESRNDFCEAKGFTKYVDQLDGLILPDNYIACEKDVIGQDGFLSVEEIRGLEYKFKFIESMNSFLKKSNRVMTFIIIILCLLFISAYTFKLKGDK